MILVIPSIEIKNGKCIYCIKGESGSENFYHTLQDNPEELCRLLRRENSKSIHVNDVDSIMHGSKENFERIIHFSKTVDIPIQVKTKFDNIEDCRHFLDAGIYRIIICDLAFVKPDDVKQLISEYLPSRIAFCLHAHNGKIHIPATCKTLTEIEYIKYVKSLGADRIIYNDAKWDNENINPDFNDLERLTQDLNIKFTLANAIHNVEQLWELNKIVSDSKFSINKIDSVIIGKPLYENIFSCQKIWRLIESKLENN